ncbi:hypothetical protein LTR66_000581 [Elasticomyces elasticus]|nr:hypothetical protein LTR66_000581 [Elasticomyces elasticus]KAK5011674.1 hypothetical protein LTR28_009139 [Elasticomyces elasticus]
MPPPLIQPLRRGFDPSIPTGEFSNQWTHPGDVFSVLLILGGEVVNRALAQLAGTSATPVTFSFGWVAYAVTAVVSAVGENKLMPIPDCACRVINGESGYVRDNASWIIGRMVRDFGYWRHNDIRKHLDRMLERKWAENKEAAEKRQAGTGYNVKRPTQAGLCVSIYQSRVAKPGYPGYDTVYFSGFLIALVQLGIAAIPCGLFGDWGVFLVTVCGILLSFATGSLPQWSKEKWACRCHSRKTIVLTRGNGSQHAIVIMGEGRGLDLEDLAAGPTNVDVSTSCLTRITVIVLAIFWILLLITASGIKQNTWFLLAVGGIGIVQNVFVAGWPRTPDAFGVPLTFNTVIGETKVMDTLFAVEEDYPRLGKSMLDTFFPSGNLRPAEKVRWAELDTRVDNHANAAANAQTNI